MKIDKISVPDVYSDSSDFRFFLKWIALAYSQIVYDTENGIDLYDPLRCKSELLWMLADTMGFKYDNRLCCAFNRLVLVYFMSMIRNKGSKDGVTLAAEVNLAQFNINKYGEENEINYDRLEDTSIPVNSVYVTPHTADGYIDVVYFSDKIPTDACIEYVRPLGMYLFQHAGVRFDARTRISVDARLTNTKDLGISIGATHVGHYRREDYARLQKMQNEEDQHINPNHKREPVYYRNSEAEQSTDPSINPGYRALYSLQIANNEHMVKSLLEPIFGLGWTPQPGDVDVHADSYVIPRHQYTSGSDTYRKNKNLRYDRSREESISDDVYTSESSSTSTKPVPAVNPIATAVGDAIAMNPQNTKYTKIVDGKIVVEDIET